MREKGCRSDVSLRALTDPASAVVWSQGVWRWRPAGFVPWWRRDGHRRDLKVASTGQGIDVASPARLAALDRLRVLDSAPEAEFDDVALLASELCQAPVALVSLVAEDRQWFKARVGFPDQQTDLDRSVCRYAVADNRLLVIPDLRLDLRTRANPLVTSEPFIRFYAGAPLRDGAGVPVGSLCVIDTQPRPDGLTAVQEAGLRALARQVMALLEARRLLVQEGARKDADHASMTQALEGERRTAELREQFVAILGHDLRNPLAAIMAGLRMVERDPAGARAASVLAMMKLSAVRMKELIDNTLDFARTRLGDGLRLHLTREPLGPVLEHVAAEVRASRPEARIALVLDVAEPVECDRDRIGQLVANLLSNAVTHGDTAQPVRVELTARHRTLTLSVVNGGEPIPPSVLDGLFQPFSRGADPEGTGLGLGLYIAAEIARAHGGSLGVTSTPVETRFTFQMPLGR